MKPALKDNRAETIRKKRGWHLSLEMDESSMNMMTIWLGIGKLKVEKTNNLPRRGLENCIGKFLSSHSKSRQKYRKGKILEERSSHWHLEEYLLHHVVDADVMASSTRYMYTNTECSLVSAYQRHRHQLKSSVFLMFCGRRRRAEGKKCYFSFSYYLFLSHFSQFRK